MNFHNCGEIPLIFIIFRKIRPATLGIPKGMYRNRKRTVSYGFPLYSPKGNDQLRRKTVNGPGDSSGAYLKKIFLTHPV